jgi:hypothetical protein
MFAALAVLTLCVVCAGLSGVAQAAEGAAAPVAAAGDEVDRAVSKAMTFLRSQQRGDGAITTGPNPHATTALAVLAMAATGRQPTDPGVEGQAMHRAVLFLLSDGRQSAEGYFGEDGSRMYGHGIVTLALAELVGMGVSEQEDALIRARCQRGVGLIVAAQRSAKSSGQRGGWRYEPRSADADLSVTVWQVMALRAARNAGLDVPTDVIDEAVGYLRRCYFSPRDAAGNPTVAVSGFAYQPGGPPTYAMAAAGLLSLQVCGRRDVPETRGAVDWLLANRPAPGANWFLYGTYYFAQGMYQASGDGSAEAQAWVRQQLLPLQTSNGAWSATNGGENQGGPIYTTAMAVLSLSVKYHYLPIYQR